MKVFTDYPFEELNDTTGQSAPLREMTLLQYDGDKYCKLQFENIQLECKSGYIYVFKKRTNGKVILYPITQQELSLYVSNS